MYVKGYIDFDQKGNEVKTALVVGRTTRDGELLSSQSGKQYASVSVKAFGRLDGTAAFLGVKSWDSGNAAKLAALKKGDTFLAAGRLSVREYNGKTYTDLMADFVLTGGDSLPINAVHRATPPTGSDFSEIEDDGELPF